MLAHLLDELVVVAGALFVVADEVAQFRLLVLERAVQLLDLADQVRLLGRQTLAVRLHRCIRAARMHTRSYTIILRQQGRINR